MSEEMVFMDAGNKLMLCELDLRDGSFVTVEPYAIYTSAKKRRCLLYYQVSRAGAHGDHGWRQVESSIATPRSPNCDPTRPPPY